MLAAVEHAAHHMEGRRPRVLCRLRLQPHYGERFRGRRLPRGVEQYELLRLPCAGPQRYCCNRHMSAVRRKELRRWLCAGVSAVTATVRSPSPPPARRFLTCMLERGRAGFFVDRALRMVFQARSLVLLELSKSRGDLPPQLDHLPEDAENDAGLREV